MPPINPITLGTPLRPSAIKVMMLGSGELGKEVVIELQRLGVEVIAVDRYDNAPAMQVAHRSYTISMLDEKALRDTIYKEKPHFIVPEVEAIATHVLVELEKEGFTVIPSAKAANLTMNREGIRKLAAEELKLRTSPYRFAGTKAEFEQAIKDIGIPCVVKPIMSSSGKGQSVVKTANDIDTSWTYAQEGGRAGGGRVIIEGFVHFDYEITLLTIRHKDGISFCAPIGHRQERGDYRESWQPHPMPDAALKKAQQMATEVVNALGGRGIFGVEFFVKGEDVYFSELSPRPHDTGMVTLISQDLSEFALHVRAILGLPIPNIAQHGPSASAALLVHGKSTNVSFSGLEEALREPDTQLRLFGKPEVDGERRMGVCLARGKSIDEAVKKAVDMIGRIKSVASFFLAALIISMSSCVSYKGQLASNTMPGRSTAVRYVDVGIGYSKTMSFLGIGGNKMSTLYQDAKRNLFQTTRLEAGQYFDNITTDVRTTVIGPYRKRELIMTADVAQGAADQTVELTEDYKRKSGLTGKTPPNAFLNIGDSVRLGIRNLLAGARVLGVGSSEATICFNDPTTNRLRVKKFPMSELYRFQGNEPVLTKINVKIGQVVNYTTPHGRGTGILVGLNTYRVLVKIAGGQCRELLATEIKAD